MDNSGLYVPGSDGLSIADLIQHKNNNVNDSSGYSNDHEKQGQYQQYQQYQHNQNSRGNHQNYQIYQNPQRNHQNYQGYNNRQFVQNQYDNNGEYEYKNEEYEKMKNLAHDVSASLESFDDQTTNSLNDNVWKNKKARKKKKHRKESKKKQHKKNNNNDLDNDDLNDMDALNNASRNTEHMESGSSTRDYGMMIIEPLLLLTIYVIMSQPFSINFASNYIESLNPTDDGNIPLIGIVIYGIILVALFLVLRKLISYLTHAS